MAKNVTWQHTQRRETLRMGARRLGRPLVTGLLILVLAIAWTSVTKPPVQKIIQYTQERGVHWDGWSLHVPSKHHQPRR